jgi:transposase
MLALIDRDPDIFLDEIQDQLEDQHGVIVSIATIWRTLKRLGITSKKGVLCLRTWGSHTNSI